MECRRTRVRLPPPPPTPSSSKYVSEMGRIITSAEVHNIAEPRHGRRIDFLVDTGASHVVLPIAWKDQFGEFEVEEDIETELANQGVARATLCGPARIQIEGFRVVHGDVVFMHMEAKEPLLGHIPLAQSGVVVDVIGHRLAAVRYFDMKTALAA